MADIIKKSFSILLKRQTNILSAAFVIMATIIFSQVLGVVRQWLLIKIFGPSDLVGVFIASAKIPDLLFQLIIAGALSSSFIPVFSDFISKEKKKEAHKMASVLLSISLGIFLILSIILFILAPFFLNFLNLGKGFSPEQILLMGKLMRIIIFGQFLFIIATFFSALLQSYNHFFLPGFAAALYNLGTIIGLLMLSNYFGIFSAAYGVILGAFLFLLAQIPLVRKLNFSFKPSFSIKAPGVIEVFKLMWPRTLSMGVFQLGSIVTISLISFLPSSGRSYVLFDYAQTLAFAPIVLFGQAIAQASFPVLSKERGKLDHFKATFMTSFNQMLFLILPISAILFVLRIPVVRLIFGTANFDWDATVTTGKILAIFSISIFSQGLIYLVSRGFYALHDTKTPLIISSITTLFMVSLGSLFILYFEFGVESLAFSYTISSVLNFAILMVFLNRKVGGFNKNSLIISSFKIFLATFFTGFALYIPIKLLDKLVFDTTRTINLLILTGISSFIGLSIYFFLTWLFNVKEATTFALLFKKIGNWREVLEKSEESIGPPINKA